MTTATENVTGTVIASDQSEAPHWSDVLKTATVGTSAWDQAYASERDCIIRTGRAAFGCGLSRERLTFGLNAREHCPRGSKSLKETERRWSFICEQVSQFKSVSERILTDALALAELAQVVPSLGKLDWVVLEKFKRFVSFSWKAEKLVIKEEKQAEKLASEIADGGYRTKNDGYDKKKIQDAIDAILGTSRKKKEKTDKDGDKDDSDQTENVTSMEAVIAWLTAAKPEELLLLASKLPEKNRIELCDALTQE